MEETKRLIYLKHFTDEKNVVLYIKVKKERLKNYEKTILLYKLLMQLYIGRSIFSFDSTTYVQIKLYKLAYRSLFPNLNSTISATGYQQPLV